MAAKNLTNIPVLVRASFPKPPEEVSKLVTWSKDVYRELENFRQLLDKLFRNSGGSSTITGDTGDPSTPPYAINADTVDGYHATDLLRYTRARSFRHFDNPSSGFVLVGRGNSGTYRLFVDDSDYNNPVIGMEAAATEASGDVEFSLPTQGPVLVGRFNGNFYRFVVSDADTNWPQLGIERITSAAILNNDEKFEKGYGWINRGRPNNNWWFWFIDDTEQDGVIGLEKFGFGIQEVSGGGY